MKEKNLVLIGMPGSGKTTVGRLLAKKLSLRFTDLDDAIEKRAGKTIPEIFTRDGEKVFRVLETVCAKEAAAREGQVIATGGGIVLKEENMRALGETGLVVFLDRTVAEICSSSLAGRPLIGKDLSRVKVLYNQRIGLYRRYGELSVRCDKPPEEVAEEIIRLVRERGENHE